MVQRTLGVLMALRVFAVGDHVEEIESLGFCKVIAVLEVDPETGFGRYRVRQFAHPHAIVDTDSHHIFRLQGYRHDPRAGRALSKCAIRW